MSNTISLLLNQVAELESQLHDALSSSNDADVSADELASLLITATELERQTSAAATYLHARIQGADVRLLHPAPITSDDTEPAAAPAPDRLAEAYEAAGASFALPTTTSGDVLQMNAPVVSRSTVMTSTWDDGREFQWVGSQCIVSR